MTRQDKEEAVNAVASRLFGLMVDDLVFEVVQQAHHEILRAQAVCSKCDTKCGLGQTILPTNQSQNTLPSASAPDSPPPGGGTSTPVIKAENGYLLECTNCNRQIGSSRFALHLASCLGLSTGVRRARNNNNKPKPASEHDSSQDSEPEEALANSPSMKGKAKGKNKQAGLDEAEFNLKRKRPGTPQASPTKPKARRGRPPGSTNLKRAKSDQDAMSSTSGTLSKVPSKLREDSTTSLAERSLTPSSSRYSSPGVGSVGRSSGFSNQSPSIAGRELNISSKARGTSSMPIIPTKRPSPPRPPAPLVHDYSIDIEGGDETGSSTDTDSS